MEKKKKLKVSVKQDDLDRMLVHGAYEKMFEGVVTFFERMTLTHVFEFLRVQIVYAGRIRDAHHENDHLIVQGELDALKMDGLFVLCDRIDRDEQAVFVFRRFKMDVPKSKWIYHDENEKVVDESDDASEDCLIQKILDDKALFPRCSKFEGVFEEREDFADRLQDVIDYKGIVVGYIGYDTADRIVKSDSEKIMKYITSVVSPQEEFAYFTRWEDHGCHGSVYYFILKKII